MSQLNSQRGKNYEDYSISMSHSDKKPSVGSQSSDGDVSPLSSRKVSLIEMQNSLSQNPPGAPVLQTVYTDEELVPSNSSNPQSPRSTSVIMPKAGSLRSSSSGAAPSANAGGFGVSTHYKGFHHAGFETIPPLQHPIKPKTRRSLFGKFINSIKDDKRRSESSSGSDGSNSNKSSVSRPLSRLSSVSGIREQYGLTSISSNHDSYHSYHPPSHHGSSPSVLDHQQTSHHAPSVSTNIESLHSSDGGNSNSVVTFNMTDLEDMAGIVSREPSTAGSTNDILDTQPSPTVFLKKDKWAAPESWDVKNDKLKQVPEGAVEDDLEDDDEYVVKRTYTLPQIASSHEHDKKSYHIRIFAEEDDFTSTLKRPYNENVDELIKYLKGRFSLSGDYKLSLRVGKVTKKLESNQKPIKIQTNLLLLSGFLESDKLDEVGRFDLSHLFKFILHRDALKQLSPAEEEYINKDLVHVNLKSKDLQKIPALCYSSKVQSLDVSNNGDISLPLDFFQMPDSQLSSLRMVNIRTKTFPLNIVYAKELVSLDLERNFISSVPPNVSLLRNLSILTLSCNKLSALPELPSSLKILDISSNEFAEYPETVNKLTNLLQLDLSYNKLKTLPPSVNNLKSVKKINISSNSLQLVDINLGSLRTLNLRHNDITEIHLHDSNIENLYLTNNLISNIAAPLKSLKTLDMQRNPITQLNIQSHNLASLNLSKAKLTSLPKIILSLTKLEKLELNKNALRELPDISNLTNLRELSIYSNNLEKLPDFSKLKKLKVIDVHDNNLKTIPDVSFVENVNISSNLVSDLSLACHDGVVYLRASDNQLNENCFDVIKTFKHLKHLSLAYNKLFEIPAGTLGHNVNLNELHLSGNYLSTLPNDFDKLEHLKVLALNGNRFRTLPADLSRLSNLEVVDVGSNDLKYNTSNSLYEWNWKSNDNLKYLNFSGNKRLEITEDLNLPNLRLLGLMDLTITSQSAIPDESIDVRVRTTSTTLGTMSYGISDRITNSIIARDFVFEKIDGGILICLFDGINSGKVSNIIRDNYHKLFEQELKKADIVTALRHSFLKLNGIINTTRLNSEDGLTGSTVTVSYVKDNKLYTANIGDTMAMLAKQDGSYNFLTVNHQPSSSVEFDRIRTSGGFVSSDDKVDGVSPVARAAGFQDLLPHIHTGPDISEANFQEEVLVIGTKELFEYLPMNTIADIVRENDNPMLTAEKLRDYAISYGCPTKVCAIVLTKKKAKKKSIQPSKQLVEDSTLRRLKPEIQPPTGELAMVFTDIKNSTSLWENYPLAMRSAIRTHNDIMRRQLHIVGGYEVKTEGDAFMVSFPTVTSAMIWCFNVQQQLLLEDWPAEIVQSEEGCQIKDSEGTVIYLGLSVRMGIHWGTPVCEPDIITRRMDYFGPMVNKTARVCAVADGGEITLTLDCLNEFRRIENAYTAFKAETLTLEEAFEDTREIAEVYSSEFEILTNIGWRSEPLGKVPLKGLETEEDITMIFPKKLGTRWKFQRTVDFTSDNVHKLRDITLRLDHISSIVLGYSPNIVKTKRTDHLDKQLLESFVSRIEHLSAMLALRDNTIGLFNNDVGLFDLVKELSELYGKYNQK